MFILVSRKDKTVRDYTPSYTITGGIYSSSGITGQKIIQGAERYYEIVEVSDTVLPFYKTVTDEETGSDILVLNDDKMFNDGFYKYVNRRFERNPNYVDPDFIPEPTEDIDVNPSDY